MRGLSAGIIAAGEGSRLRVGRPDLIKPLVPLAGMPLCHWTAKALQGAGADDISLLHNSRGRGVAASLRAAFPAVRWTFLEADTASSWESFRLMAQSLAKTAPAYLISAVDSLIAPAQARRFARAMSASQARAGLALTDFIDDEKPLWADLDASGNIEALGASCRRKRFATAGLYYMTSELADDMPEAGAFDSLRRYLASLVESGVRVAGLSLDKTLDVDRPEDLLKAEEFLKEAGASW